MLDSGNSAIGVYAAFAGSSSTTPTRILLYNSAYFAGSGTRSSVSIRLTGLGEGVTAVQTLRLTAPSAPALATEGVTIGGGGSFGATCSVDGTQMKDTVEVSGGVMTVVVQASEAVIVYL